MKKKMLVIGPGMEIGGVERSLIGLLDNIDYDQYDVDLFLYSHTGEFLPMVNEHVHLLRENRLYALSAWPIKKLFMKGHFFVGSVRALSKLVSDSRKRFLGMSDIGMTLCKRLLTPFVKKLPDNYELALGFFQPHYFVNDKVTAKRKIGWVHTDYTNANERQDAHFLLPMWKKLDAIACVSEGVKSTFDKVYPQLANKSIVVENMLSQSLVISQSKETICDFIEGDYKILSVGRYTTAKNFDEAIRAAKLLYERGRKFVWYFIGYGPDEKLLKELIAKLDAKEYVKLLGKKVNPYPYIKACNLYVQPSRYEGKAVTVREAQILGRPVLITNYATAESQLKNGFDGHICELSVEGIADGVEYMMDHPAYATKLVMNMQTQDYSGKAELQKL